MARSEANRVRLEDSERFHKAGTKRIEAAQPDEILHLILALRPSPAAPPLPESDYWATPRTPAERQAAHAAADHQDAAQEDVDAVIAFAEEHGLRVVAVHLGRATVELSGSVAQANSAFGVTLSIFKSPTETYRSHEGPIFLPRALAEIVQAVYGLDNRRMAFRMGTPALNPSFTVTPLTPPDVAGLYGFPAIPASIAQQTIAIFEFGGGYTLPDVDAFYAGLHLPNPKLVTPPIQLLGATNSPGTAASPNGADNEVLLDIDVSGSVASGATIAMYFAPFTETGWVTALDTAISPTGTEPKPSVISLSWGCPEEFWSVAQAQNLSTKLKKAAAKSITIFSATGDNGSECQIEDGLAHVNWPCIDPWVTAVGGTRIGDVSGSSFEELTWTDTGGGISTKKDSSGHLVYPLPSWQNGAGVPPSVNDGVTRGRGIPDIAAFADGYSIIRYGKKDGLGGTSEAAPLYAGLVAILNAIHGSTSAT
jgi:kumamolisin